QVAYFVDVLRIRWSRPLFLLIDPVVHVFQVPIVDERHHDPQSIQLPCAREGIAPPPPDSHLLFARLSLQPHVMYGSVACDESFDRDANEPADLRRASWRESNTHLRSSQLLRPTVKPLSRDEPPPRA